ncbi:hypothetical protein [Aldersonia kunmingensis]|uniref:WXG100-like domain-containing protein n=1 Tax=Aldersonia kunmingensis TaxID=408066 RepID=UPI0008369DA0|nr:hypothetical protein [Aldersonia kunmingensis]
MGIEIPGWLRSVSSIAVDSDWPDGDETAMRRLADSWTTTAATLNQLDTEGTEAMAKALAAIDGDTHDAMDALWDMIGGDGALGDLVEFCEHLADTLDEGATDIEHAKLMIIAALVILAAELAAAAATLVVTLGASSGAAVAAQAATQVTVRMIIRQLVQKLLSQLTVAAAKQLAFAAAKHALIGAATQGGLDAAIQGGQWLTGRRNDINVGSIGRSALSGAVDEVVSSGVSSGLGGALPDAATPLGKLATTTGVEAAAGAAGSVASTAASGDEVTWETVTSGAIGGGISGMKDGGTHAAPHIDTDSTAASTTPSAPDVPPEHANNAAPDPDSARASTQPGSEPPGSVASEPAGSEPHSQPGTQDTASAASPEPVTAAPHSEPVHTNPTEVVTQPGTQVTSSADPASTHASSVSTAPSPVAATTPTTPEAGTIGPATSAPAASPAATTPAAPSPSAPISLSATQSPAAPSAVVNSPATSAPTAAPSVGSAAQSIATPHGPASPHTSAAPHTSVAPQPPATPTARPEIVRAPEAPADQRPTPARAPETPVIRNLHTAPDAAVVSVADTLRHTNGNGAPPDGPAGPGVLPDDSAPEAQFVTLEDGTEHEISFSREQLEAEPSRFEAADAWLAERGLTRDDVQPLPVQEPFAPEKPAFAMRFTLDSHDDLDAPDGHLSTMSGHGPSFDPEYGYPFTDTGFTASERHAVPEYFLSEAAAMNKGPEMYQINPDGTERMIAVLSNGMRWTKVTS